MVVKLRIKRALAVPKSCPKKMFCPVSHNPSTKPPMAATKSAVNNAKIVGRCVWWGRGGSRIDTGKTPSGNGGYFYRSGS